MSKQPDAQSDVTPRSETSGCQNSSRPESAGKRRLISAFRCRVWAQHTRPEEQLNETACRSLIESIARNGQHQPALGRPVRDSVDHDVEIICGARRHFAARMLGFDLIVEVREMTDAQAYVAMYEENLLREADCPYVRGLTLLRALRSGTFPSQEAAASVFNISGALVCRLLKVAQLPTVIVAAFERPADIREGWGVELYKLWSNKAARYAIAARARAITNKVPRPAAREVYEMLITPPDGTRTPAQANRTRPVKGTSGTTLFHEQDRLANVAYIIPKRILTSKCREALKQFIVRALETDSADRAQSRLPAPVRKDHELSEGGQAA